MITNPWVIINPANRYWAGGDDWADRDAALVFDSKQSAKRAYRDETGGSFPRTLDAVALLDDQTGGEVDAAPAPPGGVTDGTPGQTDRVAAALAKAHANVVEAELVDTPQELDAKIRATADRIEIDVTALTGLVAEAQHREIWRDLGFDSWPRYIADVVKTNMPSVGKLVETRQPMVAMLTDAGLSQRAQAEILDVNQATISRDQKVMHDASPESETPKTVTSINGGTYQRPESKPEPKLSTNDHTPPWVKTAIEQHTPKPGLTVVPDLKPVSPKVDKLTVVEKLHAELDSIIADADKLVARLNELDKQATNRRISDDDYHALTKKLQESQSAVESAFDEVLWTLENA